MADISICSFCCAIRMVTYHFSFTGHVQAALTLESPCTQNCSQPCSQQCAAAYMHSFCTGKPTHKGGSSNMVQPCKALILHWNGNQKTQVVCSLGPWYVPSICSVPSSCGLYLLPAAGLAESKTLLLMGTVSLSVGAALLLLLMLLLIADHECLILYLHSSMQECRS